MIKKHEEFIRDMLAMGYRNPIDDNEVIIEDAVGVALVPWASGIQFDVRTVGERGKGSASRVLDKMINLADKHGVTLTGLAVPFGHAGLTKQQLRSWYRRHGFTFTNGDSMRYEPMGELLSPPRIVPGRISIRVNKPKSEPSGMKMIKLR